MDVTLETAQEANAAPVAAPKPGRVSPIMA